VFGVGAEVGGLSRIGFSTCSILDRRRPSGDIDFQLTLRVIDWLAMTVFGLPPRTVIAGICRNNDTRAEMTS